MRETIHIASSCDEKYFPGLVATFTSMIINANSEYLYRFHVIDGGINENSKSFLNNKLLDLNCNAEIEFLKPDLSVFEGLPKTFFGSPLPYARLLLPDLLQLDKLIYVDCDLLFMKDVSELWNCMLNDKYAGAALDTGILTIGNEFTDLEKFNLKPEAPFFNSGVMVLNLSAFRKFQLHKRALTLRFEFPEYFRLHDQGALNVTLYNNFVLLDESWNIQSIAKIKESLFGLSEFAINYHFTTSFKPWLNYNSSPSNRLFYVLLEEVGYALSDPAFLKSKKVYRYKWKLRKYLPLLYRIRGLKKKMFGQSKEAENDKKVARFWQDQIPIINFQEKEQRFINSMEIEWREKIKKALLNQNVKV